MEEVAEIGDFFIMVYATLFFKHEYFNIIKNELENDFFYIIDENPVKWLSQCENMNIKFISFDESLRLYKAGIVDKYLVFPTSYKCLDNFYSDLLHDGISNNDIAFVSASILNNQKISLYCYEDLSEIPYLAVHVSTKCNLHCAHCISFCGVCKNNVNISFDKTWLALLALKEKYSHIHHIQLMGGEPLLNSQIINICGSIRDMFPCSEIEILTNGTCLLDQKKEFWDAIKNNNIIISVSYYPILSDIIDDINQLLKQEHIRFKISDKIEYFERYYNLYGTSDIETTFNHCKSVPYCKNGLCLFENYLFPCMAPIAITKIGLVEYGECGINLLNSFTKDMIHELQRKSMYLCKYCHMDYNEKWKQLSMIGYENIHGWNVL